MPKINKLLAQKLTKTEFFNVYGASLVLTLNPNISDKLVLVDLLAPVAKKYYEISKYAVLSELRYFRYGGRKAEQDDVKELNVELLKRLGIKNWRIERKTLSLKDAAFLYKMGNWDIVTKYGGKPWQLITEATLKLEVLFPVNKDNLVKIIAAIDQLNDLEHNTQLYLSAYCTFNLYAALELKAKEKPKQIIKYCSRDIYSMYNEYST